MILRPDSKRDEFSCNDTSFDIFFLISNFFIKRTEKFINKGAYILVGS